MNSKRGLGRGLGALIPVADAAGSSGTPGFSDGLAAHDAAGMSSDSPTTGGVPPFHVKRAVDVTDRRTMDGVLEAPSASEGAWIDHLLERPTVVESPDPVPGLRFADIPLTQIRPNPRQPRTVFDDEALAELVFSIQEIGLLQPIVVRPVEDGYELVAGERRLRAATAAGWASIPAIVRETAEESLLRDALLENLHRANLNVLEEAAAYQQMLEDFGCTQEELATKIGRSRPQVTNTLRLMKLPATVQRRVAVGVLSAGHARALLGLPTHEAMDALAARIVAEGLSVRTVEEIVALGGERPTRTRQRSARAVTAELADRAAQLADRFDTRVQIQAGKSKGRVIIEFAGSDDLDRILELMAGTKPTEDGAARQAD